MPWDIRIRNTRSPAPDAIVRPSRPYYRFPPPLPPLPSPLPPPSFRGFLRRLVVPPALAFSRQRGHYVQLQEAFSRSNSLWRSFDHDPEERLGSIRTEISPPPPPSAPRKLVFAVRSRPDSRSTWLSSFILLIALAGPWASLQLRSVAARARN